MRRFNYTTAGKLLARAIAAKPLSRRPIECETDEFLALPKTWRAIKILRKKNFSIELVALLVEGILNEQLQQRGLKPVKVSPRRFRRILRKLAPLKRDADICRWLHVKLPAKPPVSKRPVLENSFVLSGFDVAFPSLQPTKL